MRQRDLLNRIDLNVAVLCEKSDSQQRELTEHKDNDKDRKIQEKQWQERIEESLTICPKEDQIEAHGKELKDIGITVKAVRLIAALILLIGTVFGIWFAFTSKAKGDSIPPDTIPYIYQYEIDKEIALRKTIGDLNEGFGAQSLGVHFRCSNITSETPTLQMTTLNHCLMCKDCEDYVRDILIHIQTIALGWFKWSGSQSMEIYNTDGILVLTMDTEGEINVANDVKFLVDKGVY